MRMIIINSTYTMIAGIGAFRAECIRYHVTFLLVYVSFLVDNINGIDCMYKPIHGLRIVISAHAILSRISHLLLFN